MEILEKYCQKKWISLLGIIGGAIPLGIMVFLGLFKFYSLGSFYALLYYLGLLVFIADMVLSGYTLLKKSKSVHIIIHIILVVLSFILVLQYRVIINALAGQLSGLLYYAAANYNSFISEGSKLIISAIVCIGLLIHSILVFINIFALGINEDVKDIDTEKLKQDASEITDKARKGVKSLTVKGKAFVSTKNGKRTVGIVGLILAFLVGIWGYFTFFNKTDIDLASNINVEFTGKDGEGNISVIDNKIDYDKTNNDMSTFVYGVSYSYAPKSGELSNGDKVVVTVEYSKETANSLKLNVTNSTKEFTVEGLTKEYKEAKEVDKKLANTLKKDAQSSFDEEMEDTSLIDAKSEYVGSYFAKAKKANSFGSDNCYIAVYKVTGVEKSFWSDEQKEVVYYYAVYTTGVDSSYDSDKSYWNIRKLSDDSYNYISDVNQVEDSLNSLFSKTTITQFK